MIENKTVPIEVTNALQEIADKYNYTVDLMHQHKQQIIDELKQTGRGYIVKFLFPEGFDHHEKWIHALIRMEIRRLQALDKGRVK
ncbi:hypothetical protein MK805_07155 [Shimazuella sp. AN120528]|nr:hypothetical protein [Shimazuella soli]